MLWLFSLTEFERHFCVAGRFHSCADRNCFRFAHPASAYPEHPILAHFRPSGPSANNRYGHLESNALIDIEFGEFRQKLKNLEFRQNSIFWDSLGAIWIDSMSFGVVPPLSIFLISFEFASSSESSKPPSLQSSEG